MKHQLILLLLLSVSVQAQMELRVNNSSTQQGDKGISNCQSTATYFNQTNPVCDSTILDQFCFNMSDNLDYSAHEWPGCPDVILDNPHWMSFIAGSEQLSVEINIENCQLDLGVQIAIYRLPKNMAYGPGQEPADLDVLGFPITGCYYAETPQKHALKFTAGATPGQLFGVLVDGWEGDICNIQINVLKGADAPGITSEINSKINYPDQSYGFQEDTLCQGSREVNFTLEDPVEDASHYIWTLNGETVATELTNGRTAKLSMDNEGMANVCVQATNHCDTTAPLCVNVPVYPLKTIETKDTICDDAVYAWSLEDDEWMGEFGPFHTYSGDTQIHSFYYEENQHCRINTTLDLHIDSDNSETPIPLDTFVSFDEMPVDILDTLINQPTTQLLVSRESSNYTCDQYYNVNLYVLGGKFFIGMKCSGDGGAIFHFDGFNDPEFYTEWNTQFQFIDENEDLSIEYEWAVDGQSGIIGNSSTLQLSANQLEELMSEGLFHLNLRVKIKHKDQTIYDVDAPEYEYSSGAHIPDFDGRVIVKGDSTLWAMDSLSTYQWYTCGPTFQKIDSADERNFTPSAAGNYAVILQQGECRDTSACIYFTPNATSTQNRYSNLTMSPNPTNGYFKLSGLPQSVIGDVYTIHSSSGSIVQTGRIQRNAEFDINRLPSGVYYLQVGGDLMKVVKL